MDRCNLTILNEPGQEDLAAFLADQAVEITASLPCYLEENVDQQRGKGVFESSLAGLRQLNALGYGQPDSSLTLNLVYNPLGPVLPPDQANLEAAYKHELAIRYGITFNHLLALANMPIQRFGSQLLSKGQFQPYMDLLKSAHRDENLAAVMCRNLISVDWQGYVYDCDFNQMLKLPLGGNGPGRTHLAELLDRELTGARIARRRPLLRLHRRPGQQLRRGARCRIPAPRQSGGVRAVTFISIILPVLNEEARKKLLRRTLRNAHAARRCPILGFG